MFILYNSLTFLNLYRIIRKNKFPSRYIGDDFYAYKKELRDLVLQYVYYKNNLKSPQTLLPYVHWSTIQNFISSLTVTGIEIIFSVNTKSYFPKDESRH